ncbi:hypothetical protein R5P86_08355 [Oenococcus oeni]|uniref:hypothetical protein n=1 Tax=Oenococcus oeni TaxID=1247 RepID=UPI00050DF470|nr:hypothetical protein [Oenococcus oeni]KGH87574.1 hypothetical protein X350_08275 [Oenococcus oeni S12]
MSNPDEKKTDNQTKAKDLRYIMSIFSEEEKNETFTARELVEHFKNSYPYVSYLKEEKEQNEKAMSNAEKLMLKIIKKLAKNEDFMKNSVFNFGYPKIFGLDRKTFDKKTKHMTTAENTHKKGRPPITVNLAFREGIRSFLIEKLHKNKTKIDTTEAEIRDRIQEMLEEKFARSTETDSLSMDIAEYIYKIEKNYDIKIKEFKNHSSMQSEMLVILMNDMGALSRVYKPDSFLQAIAVNHKDWFSNLRLDPDYEIWSYQDRFDKIEEILEKSSYPQDKNYHQAIKLIEKLIDNPGLIESESIIERANDILLDYYLLDNFN